MMVRMFVFRPRSKATPIFSLLLHGVYAKFDPPLIWHVQSPVFHEYRSEGTLRLAVHAAWIVKDKFIVYVSKRAAKIAIESYIFQIAETLYRNQVFKEMNQGNKSKHPASMAPQTSRK